MVNHTIADQIFFVKNDIRYFFLWSGSFVFGGFSVGRTQLFVCLLFKVDRLQDLDFKWQPSYQLIPVRGNHGNRFI